MKHYTREEKHGRVILTADDGYRLDFGEGTYPKVRVGATDKNVCSVRTITDEEYAQICAEQEAHLNDN